VALSGGLQAKYALSTALVCLLSKLRALRSRIITPSRFSMRTLDSATQQAAAAAAAAEAGLLMSHLYA
jgi:hypothetical protein